MSAFCILNAEIIEIILVCTLNCLQKCPREDAGGLSRQYVLRIPSVS